MKATIKPSPLLYVIEKEKGESALVRTLPLDV